jgi:hypothetical protein
MPIAMVGGPGSRPIVSDPMEAGAAPPGGSPPPDEAAGYAERAMELVLEDQSEFADAATHDAQTAVRQAADRRIELRAKVREIRRQIAEAQANRSVWDKIADAFKWIGAALATVAAAALSVVSFGSAAAGAVAGSVALWVAVAGAAAGGITAGAKLASAESEADAANLGADRMGVDDALAMTQDQRAQQQAFAEAIAATEEALRRQALAWIRNEDDARRVVAR